MGWWGGGKDFHQWWLLEWHVLFNECGNSVTHAQTILTFKPYKKTKPYWVQYVGYHSNKIRPTILVNLTDQFHSYGILVKSFMLVNYKVLGLMYI